MDVHEAIRTRRSVRNYQPDPIPDDVVAPGSEVIPVAVGEKVRPRVGKR